MEFSRVVKKTIFSLAQLSEEILERPSPAIYEDDSTPHRKDSCKVFTTAQNMVAIAKASIFFGHRHQTSSFYQ
jgi:hypothetical protein